MLIENLLLRSMLAEIDEADSICRLAPAYDRTLLHGLKRKLESFRFSINLFFQLLLDELHLCINCCNRKALYFCSSP